LEGIPAIVVGFPNDKEGLHRFFLGGTKWLGWLVIRRMAK